MPLFYHTPRPALGAVRSGDEMRDFVVEQRVVVHDFLERVAALSARERDLLSRAVSARRYPPQIVFGDAEDLSDYTALIESEKYKELRRYIEQEIYIIYLHDREASAERSAVEALVSGFAEYRAPCVYPYPRFLFSADTLAGPIYSDDPVAYALGDGPFRIYTFSGQIGKNLFALDAYRPFAVARRLETTALADAPPMEFD
mgnify:FL=1